MAKRSFGPFELSGSPRVYYYDECEFDLIIAAAGGLPEGNVRCERIRPEDGEIEIVDLSRWAALEAMLQTASRAYAVSRKSHDTPTPAQLAKALRRIEKAAGRLQEAVAVIAPSDPDPLSHAQKSAGLRRAVIGTLSKHAHKDAKSNSDYRAKHISDPKADRIEVRILGNEFMRHAISGVERLRRWAAEGFEAETAKGTLSPNERPTGDQPFADFVGELLDIYRYIFEKTPRTSVGASGGEPGGPTIKYLKACLSPVLGDETPSGHALRARIRTWSKQP